MTDLPEQPSEPDEEVPALQFSDLKRAAMDRLKEIDAMLERRRGQKANLAAEIRELVKERATVHRVVNSFEPRTRNTNKENT